jgi:hypothetical protein
VSAAWGVGGAVAGEAAATILIRETDAEVISEAKSPYQRQIASEGGMGWQPAPTGKVLTADEIEQLRALVTDVNNKYESVLDEAGMARPWDIEFGFIDGQLTLFQIRPLVERGSGTADDLLRQRRPNRKTIVGSESPVRLDALPAT